MQSLDLTRVHDLFDGVIPPTRRSGKSVALYVSIFGWFDSDVQETYVMGPNESYNQFSAREFARFATDYGNYFGYSVESVGNSTVVCRRLYGRYVTDGCGTTKYDDDSVFKARFIENRRIEDNMMNSLVFRDTVAIREMEIDSMFKNGGLSKKAELWLKS